MEKVQNRATKRILEMIEQSYRKRIAAMNLPTLKEGRKTVDITTFKFINQIDSVETDHFLKILNKDH